MTRLLGAVALTALATAAQAQEELKVYIFFEYIPQELVDKFEAATGIEEIVEKNRQEDRQDNHDGLHTVVICP